MAVIRKVSLRAGVQAGIELSATRVRERDEPSESQRDINNDVESLSEGLSLHTRSQSSNIEYT